MNTLVFTPSFRIVVLDKFRFKMLHKLRAGTGTLVNGWKGLHTSPVQLKEVAGRYRAILGRKRPLTYEMAFNPHDIADKKAWNSYNTGQLEGTFLHKEDIGQDLPHKLLVEDMFIRKFMNGTWPEAIVSEIIIKRQHNLIRIACIILQSLPPKKVYFLIGYSEELLSLWLKCPVKLELQTLYDKTQLYYKYV